MARFQEKIKKMKEDLATKPRNTNALIQLIKSIPGFVDADLHEIDEVDKIRLRADNLIERALQSL